jgi:hypothetical protein
LGSNSTRSRKSQSVSIRGDGAAAYCCAHLLRNAGFEVAMERLDRPRVPAIMLSDAAVELIRDVFGNPSLFSGLPRIERRNVVWGDAADPRALPHSAVVISEAALLDSLIGGHGTRGFTGETDDPRFTVYTSRPMPPAAIEQRFGSRRASAAPVVLNDAADLSACWIESVESGWLFLIPNALESTWLLAIGGPVEALLRQSRAIAPRIQLLSGRSAEFSSCPRILSPLCGDGWLACGSVALGFDPICGDGTAQAIREAILASAVIRAIAGGGDSTSLFSHYEMLLTAAMRRHLALCAEFYRSGGSGSWWQTELESLEAGFRWCTSKLAGASEPRYQ